MLLHETEKVRSGLNALLRIDPVFSKRNIGFDNFAWPYMGPGFATLTRIVLGQQVSTKAADALWLKFSSHIDNIHPATIIKLSNDSFHNLGISRQKISYIKGLAEAVDSGSLDLDILNERDDRAVYEALTSLKGFGRWSAEMYLMFGLARPDIWAPGDLGIREGMRLYLERPDRPSPEEVMACGERFKPYRTAASLLLWTMKAQG